MRVVCKLDTVDQIDSPSVRETLRNYIRGTGSLSELSVGDEYLVQAVEWRGGGWWLYLHTVEALQWPTPYPAELFEFTDVGIPDGWCIAVTSTEQRIGIHRITFTEWATDQSFFERLVDGEETARAVYKTKRLRRR